MKSTATVIAAAAKKKKPAKRRSAKRAPEAPAKAKRPAKKKAAAVSKEPPAETPAPPKKKKAPGPYAEIVAATAARIANGAVLGAALLGAEEQEAVAERVRVLTEAARAMGLRDTQRVFCELVVLDRMSQWQAYQQAMNSRCTVESASSSASAFLRNPKIVAYCDLLRQDMARSAAMDRDAWMRYMEEVMMTPAGKVTADHRLCQKFKERSRETPEGHTEREVEVLMPNKLEAAKALGQARGWVKEVVEVHDGRPEVDVEDLVKESPALQAEMARMLAAAGRKGEP